MERNERPPARPKRFRVDFGPWHRAGPRLRSLRRNRPELPAEDVAGCVLLAERAVPDDIGRIIASAGTLTLSGAVLSHVSLLSREFGKPSVSLSGMTPAHLSQPEEDGVLVFEDVVGNPAGARLDEGDVVMIDGGRGLLTIPGGFEPEARARVRRVFGPLAAYGKLPADDALLVPLIRAQAEDGLAFLLEAAFPYRLVPAGPASRRLLEALERTVPRGEIHGAIEALCLRVLASAAVRCEEALTSLQSAEDLEDLQRGMRGLESALNGDLELIEDLRGDPDRLEQRLEPVLQAAAERRAELEAALRKAVGDALRLTEEQTRARLGGLFRLLRRARAAHLGAEDVGRLQKRLAEQLAEERKRAGTHLVVPIDPGVPHDRSLVGGKAQALFEIAHAVPADCRIPRGFVVTSAAYRLHLFGETGEKLRLAAEEIDERMVSRKARAAILSGDIPDEVRRAVAEAHHRLSVPRYAVRSSATIEDGSLGSLAGLFDSYLGVTGLDDLVHRIRWAWASLWNARALAALSSLGLSPLHARQAVLVQEMIDTRAAGVLFSRDPTGRSDTLLINAAWGLGEGISQGELSGDLYWVRRSTGRLIVEETGRSASRIELAPQGMGTVEVPLPADLRGRGCLSSEDIARLADLARAVEDATGRAQDIEFGFDHEGGLVVFQMRRIVPRRPVLR